MSDDLKAELEQAAWHVAMARDIVARQLAVVETFREDGHSGVPAGKETLDNFIRTLRSLEYNEVLLRAELRREALKRQ